MSNIRINTTELMQVLDILPAEQNIMLVGNHGIGKTDFMPPYWFPTDGKPIVLFLDELNRARPEILQTIMDLALNRKLAGRALPEGSRIIAAVNEGDQYQLTDLDPALVSRFNVYAFSPTPQEWLLWAGRAAISGIVGAKAASAFRYGFSSVDVVQFDCGITQVQNLKKCIKDVLAVGRGGTSFQEPIDYAHVQDYDGLVMLTDGFAPVPTLPDGMRCKIIWVCRDRHCYDANHAWMEKLGRVCTMEIH